MATTRVEIDDELEIDGVVDITHAVATDRFPDAPTQIGGFVLDRPRGGVVWFSQPHPAHWTAPCATYAGHQASHST